MTTLTFQNTTLSVINHNDQIWFTTLEVGKGLGYPHPVKAIQKIFDRHADEFTPCMTAIVDMKTAGGMQKVRVFSLRGTHLIAMFSHTKLAKEFRRWVLDILDKEVEKSQNSKAIQPVAADLQQIIQTAVQKALPPQMPLYQARNLHEVLPLAALYSKACTLAKDFKQLYKFLQQKGYGSMAEICLNHAEELNEHTALMARVDGCIQILMQDLSDKDQEFIHRLFLK